MHHIIPQKLSKGNDRAGYYRKVYTPSSAIRMTVRLTGRTSGGTTQTVAQPSYPQFTDHYPRPMWVL